MIEPPLLFVNVVLLPLNLIDFSALEKSFRITLVTGELIFDIFKDHILPVLNNIRGLDVNIALGGGTVSLMVTALKSSEMP